jgi:endonuclease YncB( thermonuclease family)
MRLLLVLVLVALPSLAKDKKEKGHGHSAKGALLINDEQVQVRWTDGDSFKFLSGPYDGKGTRLMGYNTLEAYGPVHRWGTWSAKELFALAEQSSQVAASREWSCTTDGKVDGYNRVLVNCPDLAEEMIRQGHALAYAVEGTSPERLLNAQRDAMEHQRGMWAKGVVKGVITSLHSVGEDGDDEKEPYNRVVDTRTGAALKRVHQSRYETCQEVCEVTDGDTSCMTYVPFKRRYKNKPDCLK